MRYPSFMEVPPLHIVPDDSISEDEAWIVPSEVVIPLQAFEIEDAVLSGTINAQTLTVTIRMDGRQLSDAILKYGMMERIKKQQSATRGGWAAAGSPPVVPQPTKAATEKASDEAQTKLHLQALKDISKSLWWWQAQKIAKAVLQGVNAPKGEVAERYMLALEQIYHTSHHQEAVGIACEALNPPPPKKKEEEYDWD